VKRGPVMWHETIDRRTVLRCIVAAPMVAASTALGAPLAKPPSPLDAAIDELRKEFQAHLRDPRIPVREACDYFVAKPSPAVTADVVFAAVETRLDTDTRTAAYIRWQLLSALPVEIAEKDSTAAIALYRKAPASSPRIGLSPGEQAKLDKALEGRRTTDDVILTSQLQAAVREWSKANKHVIAYRNEFYRRLPKKLPTFIAAFQDAFERQNLAAGAEDFSPLVIADVQNWLVAGDADAAKCATLAEVLAQLRAKEAPSYYGYAAVRYGKLTWVKEKDSMDPRKKLTYLHQSLVEAAARK
jgi:hypothetical protein